jgi:hypothetical protein
MDENENTETVELTDKQMIVDNLARGVLQLAVSTLAGFAANKAYDKLVVQRRFSNVETDED